MANYNKTEKMTFQGKAKWAKLLQPDMKFPPGKWNIQLYPNTESLEKIRELQARGLKNKLSKDDTGWYVNIGRPVSKTYKGVVKPFTPPVVVLKKGDDAVPFSEPVGNDSDVTLLCEVYEHGTPGGGKAVAMRLEKVRVDNLVPFVSSKDLNEEEQADFEEIKNQPEHLF